MIKKVLIIVVITSILGEFKISPFDSSFRFGLGSAGFFFLLLFYKDVPYRFIGLITGIFTTFFRISLDYFLIVESFSFLDSLQTHIPIIGYYYTFAFLLQMIKRKKLYRSPLLLGLWGALCDGLANMVELLIINSFTTIDILGSFETTYVISVAILRSFFVVGLCTILQANRLSAIYLEQRSRFEQVQTILSELYIEGFYLKKTLNDIEIVTAKGHKLYRELKESTLSSELSTLALTVAQELHEVKKDNQRILAGLEKVMGEKNSKMSLKLSEIIDLSIKSNRKYVDYLNKDVQISTIQQIDFKVECVYPLLVIINNLVANAIEAIQAKGEVHIDTRKEHGHLKIMINDNGIGISKDEQEVIFEPGFTTKFDKTGQASTGIGLSHVKSMVKELGGSISVSSEQTGTSFKVDLPLSVIQIEG